MEHSSVRHELVGYALKALLVLNAAGVAFGGYSYVDGAAQEQAAQTEHQADRAQAMQESGKKIVMSCGSLVLAGVGMLAGRRNPEDRYY